MQTLATDEIAKSYRGRRVVNGVSLHINQAEVVGLLGPNGAGKTTTFYMAVGLVPPDSGRAHVFAGPALWHQLSAARTVSISQADGGTKHSGGAGGATPVVARAP